MVQNTDQQQAFLNAGHALEEQHTCQFMKRVWFIKPPWIIDDQFSKDNEKQA